MSTIVCASRVECSAGIMFNSVQRILGKVLIAQTFGKQHTNWSAVEFGRWPLVARQRNRWCAK